MTKKTYNLKPLEQYACSYKQKAKAKGTGSTTNTTLAGVFKTVTTDGYTKTLTTRIRDAYAKHGSSDIVDALKQQLTAAYPCARFKPEGTRYNTLIAFSGIYVADVEQTDVGQLFKDKYVLAAHKSSTAKGYAVYFKIENLGTYSDEKKETFKRIGRALLAYITTRYGLKVDPLIDATRARFIAHDSSLYLNLKAQQFPSPAAKATEPPTVMRYADLVTYVGECNARGVGKDVVLQKLHVRMFPKSTTIKSAADIQAVVDKLYSAYSDQHGTAKGNREEFYPELKEYLLTTYKLYYNVIEEDYHVTIGGSVINDYDKILSLIQADIVTTFKKHVGKETLNSMLVAYCTTEYNPYEQYFASLPSVSSKHNDSIHKLAKCFTIDTDVRLFESILTKWLVQSIKCLLEPDFVNRYCFVFFGGERIGKSTFAQWLSVKPEWYTEEQLAFGDKDSRLLICRKWIANLEELSKDYNRRDINELKALISASSVSSREAYGRKARTRPRICSFIGSTNNEKLLVDTGNTRWLIFHVLKIDWRYKQRVDVNELWAEVYSLYKAGYDYTLSEEETTFQQLINETHRYTNYEEDILADNYMLDDQCREENFISSRTLFDDLSIQYERIHVGKFYTALQKLFGQSHQRQVSRQRARGHYLIKIDPNVQHTTMIKSYGKGKENKRKKAKS